MAILGCFSQMPVLMRERDLWVKPANRCESNRASDSAEIPIGCLLLGQGEQFAVAVPFQEAIESLHEAFALIGIAAGDVLKVGAEKDQAAGTALAFGGGDAGLGAPDLAFEVVALASLGILQLFFPCLEILFQGLLAGQKLLKFFLWLHSCRW